jgi:penicillin-binding protein 2
MRKKYTSVEIDNPLDELAFVQETSERMDDNKLRWQYKILTFLIMGALSILFFRIFYLQIVKGEHYKDLADNNRIRKVVIRAPRGVIKDINGEILARNIPSFELNFIPAYLPKDDRGIERIVKEISAMTGGNKEDLKKILKEYPASDRQAYQLVEHLEDNTALRLAEKSDEFPGLMISKVAQREYPFGEGVAHVIGYDGKVTKEELKKYPEYLLMDYIGKSGVEEVYEKYLHGKHGEHRYEVNSMGKMIRDLGSVAPEAGYTLDLNIDIRLQEKIFSEAEKMMSKNEDTTGIVVVALNPRDGAVRALVNYPSFDNNLFSRGISTEAYKDLIENPHKPLLNRAVSGLYPPGSTYKPLVAAAALEEGIVNEHKTINCTGHIDIGQWAFPDWKVHGQTNLKKAIAESCDVYFYAIGGGWGDIGGLGINQLRRYSKFFGLTDYLGIDLPGEKQGDVPGNTWKFKTFGEKWYIGDTYHGSIGQGYVTTTPLQVASIAATIANGGKVYRPRIAKELTSIDNKDKVRIEENILSQDFISAYNINLVREGMKYTVTSSSGSGRSMGTLKVTSAGKTGTAQFGSEDKTHSWYISFAPYENTELAMVVLVESGGGGHDWAVPLTKEIYKWYFDEDRGRLTPEVNEDKENNKENNKENEGTNNQENINEDQQ